MNRAALISEIADDLASFRRVLMAKHAGTFSGRMPTPAQIGILSLIAHGGPQNLKDLSANLCISSSAVTQLVDGLVRGRLLTRTEDADDRRRIFLALTVSGKRTLILAKKRRLTSLTKLFAPLSLHEVAAWKRLQRKIIERAS